MEGILLIIFAIWIFWPIIRWFFSLFDSGTSGGASIGVFEIRLKDAHLGDTVGSGGTYVKEIEGRGLFPITRTTRLGFITSLFDETTGELEPVISAIETFQESDSVVYRHQIEVGDMAPNYGFPDWVRLGVIVPEVIQPPYGGERKLLAILRMIDLNDPPNISHGFHQKDDPGILWQNSLSFSWTFSEKGYSEAAAHREEAMGIALKIGVAVSMADGSLDDQEGNKLKLWIIREVEHLTGERQQRLKNLYNNALKEGYDAAKSGELSLSTLTQRLNEIGEKRTKYETIELCFDVMAADGVASAEELHIIRKVAQALELDLDEIEKIRDTKIIGLNTGSSSQASIEVLLGIESNWTKEKIKKHLRSEFQKWNNRLNTLTEGAERDNAQRMLDLIAEARKKYG